MSILAAFAVLAIISLNLPLRFGTGIPEQDGDLPQPFPAAFARGALNVFIVLIFWCFFSWVFPSPGGAFLEYFLAFPLLIAAGTGLEYLMARLEDRKPALSFPFSAAGSWPVQNLVALILTLRLASRIQEALVMALSFSAGNLLVLFILWAIRRRSALERVPAFLRGIPLFLISSGLLSLVFASLEGLFYRVLFP